MSRGEYDRGRTQLAIPAPKALFSLFGGRIPQPPEAPDSTLLWSATGTDRHRARYRGRVTVRLGANRPWIGHVLGTAGDERSAGGSGSQGTVFS